MIIGNMCEPCSIISHHVEHTYILQTCYSIYISQSDDIFMHTVNDVDHH